MDIDDIAVASVGTVGAAGCALYILYPIYIIRYFPLLLLAGLVTGPFIALTTGGLYLIGQAQGVTFHEGTASEPWYTLAGGLLGFVCFIAYWFTVYRLHKRFPRLRLW